MIIVNLKLKKLSLKILKVYRMKILNLNKMIQEKVRKNVIQLKIKKKEKKLMNK